MRPLFVVYRSAGAILTVVAVVVQLQTSVQTWSDQGIQDVGTKLVNFFSFFTIQSNVATAVTLAIGAVLLARRGGTEARWYGVLRACVTTYIATTGVVYNLLLRGIELPQGTTVPWTNEVLHVVVPIVMLVDWIFAPGRRRLGFGVVGIAVIYPIVWAAYTMIRGPLVQDEVTGADWYPYPFLNPNNFDNGYVTVALYVLLIAGIIAGAACGIVAISRIRRGRST